MASIAVVIVNYNTCEYLRECLENVQLETPSEIIVVDNASSDGSADMVRANFPMVKLHDNMWNVGYGAAANQGIASCTAQYVLLLNSDTRVSAGALQALSAYLDSIGKSRLPALVWSIRMAPFNHHATYFQELLHGFFITKSPVKLFAASRFSATTNNESFRIPLPNLSLGSWAQLWPFAGKPSMP